MERFFLNEKVAVVTGAGSGIGRSTAITFAERGAKLALIDINAPNLESVAEIIERQGGSCKIYVSDVADEKLMKEVFENIFIEFENVDILANVAGIWERIPFLKLSMGNFNRMIAVNLLGCFNCCRSVLPNMVKRRYGKIVSVGSIAGKDGSTLGSSHYAASKGAISAFSASLAREFGAFGLNINVVCPGLIETPIGEATGQDGMDTYVKKSALKRIGKPDDVANVIAFLASNAASFITGQTVNICGGHRFD